MTKIKKFSKPVLKKLRADVNDDITRMESIEMFPRDAAKELRGSLKDFTEQEFNGGLHEWSESAVFLQVIDDKKMFIEIPFNDYI